MLTIEKKDWQEALGCKNNYIRKNLYNCKTAEKISYRPRNSEESMCVKCFRRKGLKYLFSQGVLFLKEGKLYI